MKTLCVWGDTRADVLAGYEAVSKRERKPARITWRLTASFDGSKVGDDYYLPTTTAGVDVGDIKAAYGSKGKKSSSKKVKIKPTLDDGPGTNEPVPTIDD